MLGYTREEILSAGVRWHEITPPKWKEADAAALSQLAEKGVAPPWEKELIRKDGSCVPVLAAAAMLGGSQGIAIAVDLTDRKRAERANEERARIASLIAEVGVALTHGGGLRAPHLTNNVLGDPRIGDPAWAAREGMVAFGGHPLMVESLSVSRPTPAVSSRSS
jgi:hypothetical protein